MKTNDPDRILRVLKRLLRVTVANGATPAEAEIAAATARRLLDKHGLTIEQVAELRDDASAVVTEEVDSDYLMQPRWFTALAAAIAYGFECRAVSNLVGPMAFVGLAQDVAVAAYLFRVLVVELPKAAEVEAKRFYARGNHKTAFKRDFLLGCAHQIGGRLMRSRNRPERQGLIVLKEDLIDRHLGEMPTIDRSCDPDEVKTKGAYTLGRMHGNGVCLDERPLPSAEHGFLAEQRLALPEPQGLLAIGGPDER